MSKAHLRGNNKTFGKRSIERTFYQIEGRLAYQRYKWPTRSVRDNSGGSIRSHVDLIEISLLTSTMYYPYGKNIYKDFKIDQIVNIYDLYTNSRAFFGSIAIPISPYTTYWVNK